MIKLILIPVLPGGQDTAPSARNTPETLPALDFYKKLFKNKKPQTHGRQKVEGPLLRWNVWSSRGFCPSFTQSTGRAHLDSTSYRLVPLRPDPNSGTVASDRRPRVPMAGETRARRGSLAKMKAKRLSKPWEKAPYRQQSREIRLEQPGTQGCLHLVNY